MRFIGLGHIKYVEFDQNGTVIDPPGLTTQSIIAATIVLLKWLFWFFVIPFPFNVFC